MANGGTSRRGLRDGVRVTDNARKRAHVREGSTTTGHQRVGWGRGQQTVRGQQGTNVQKRRTRRKRTATTAAPSEAAAGPDRRRIVSVVAEA